MMVSHAVAFSPDGRTVLTGSQDKTAGSGTPRRKTDRRADGAMMVAFDAVAFSPDGRTVLTGSDDKTARLWDAATGKPIGEPLRHDGGAIYAVPFNPDGRTVLTGSVDKTARLWDAANGKPLGEPMDHGNAVAPLPSAPTAHGATGSQDNTAHLWDVATGKPLREPMRHDDEVAAVAFSPDGRTVLTGSDDNTARLWDADAWKADGRADATMELDYRRGFQPRRPSAAHWLQAIPRLWDAADRETDA